ncbi:hypothetical protein EBR03_08260 [bacterium]|nr:hypothetical protein [bacterium]
MARYKPDGSVIPSGIPVTQRSPKNGHYSMFGLYKGMVYRVVYPEAKENITKERVEYVVKVRGQLYPNAVDLRKGGAIYNYQERIYKNVEHSRKDKIDQSVYDSDLDGEFVYVMFLEGNGDIPIILGAAEHPQHPKYKKCKESDGRFSVEEFNGVEIRIDKDSNLSLKQVGRKAPDGKIENQDAVDSQINIAGNGDIEINTHGTSGTSDLRMKLTKKDKKLEAYAQDNKVILSDAGIVVEDKFTNKIEMKSGAVEVTVAGNATVNVSGNATVSASGQAKFEGSGGTTVGSGGSLTKVDGSAVNLGGGGPPVARLGDMVIGVGNLGAPVVSQIVQGSSKVKSA